MTTPEPRHQRRPLLRLWHHGQTGLPTTWLILPASNHHVVRRTLDKRANPPGNFGPELAEVLLPPETFKTVMAELELVSVRPTASSALVLDAGTYGVEIDHYPAPVVLAWAGRAPIGWESLEAWHQRTAHRLDALLPPMGGGGYSGYQTGQPLTFD